MFCSSGQVGMKGSVFADAAQWWLSVKMKKKNSRKSCRFIVLIYT